MELRSILEEVAKSTISDQIDYLELRYHKISRTIINVVNGVVRSVNSGSSRGIAIRSLVNGSWGSASTENLSKSSIEQAARKASKLAVASLSSKSRLVQLAPIETNIDEVRLKVGINPLDVSIEEKLNTAFLADTEMKSIDERIINRETQYFDLNNEKIICTSEGTNLHLLDTRTGIYCSATALGDNGNREQATKTLSGTRGFELLSDSEVRHISKSVAKQALRLSNAKTAPAGENVVILSPELVRLLGHEAFGHTNEADLVAGGSVLRGKIGEKIADESITILDNPTTTGSFGWLPGYDDEGTKIQRTVLVDRGYLLTHMHNRESAHEMNAKPTGNARAQDHLVDPIIRMTNTEFLGGESSKTELIEDTKKGILLEGRTGGQADLTGEFMFGVIEGHDIVNGEIGDSFKEVTISGIVFDVLKAITGLSKEEHHGYSGYCGKGQVAFTGGGGPYMRTALNIGGK